MVCISALRASGKGSGLQECILAARIKQNHEEAKVCQYATEQPSLRSTYRGYVWGDHVFDFVNILAAVQYLRTLV